MVLTIEPGLYFGPGENAAADPFRGIGVRIEDDVAVTEDGCEVLTSALPTDPDSVEAMVGASP
jgi:Xaa-Pro aminopeptidase